MPEEHSPDPIAGPTPVKNPAGSNLLARLVATAAATVGGFLLFAPMLTPTCAKGATRSARLKWEQRQREIQTALNEAALRGDLPRATLPAESPAIGRAEDESAGSK